MNPQALQKKVQTLNLPPDFLNIWWHFNVYKTASDYEESKLFIASIKSCKELTLNESGESIISYADYAIAMVDEVVSGNHIRERISVVRK